VTAAGFGSRLSVALATSGRLCVGIDPHPFLLREWGLEDRASSLREFGLRVIDAAVDRVGVVKPQLAFFERFGAAGYVAAEEILRTAREAGLLVIADVKRGDVGSTVEAYAQAWLQPGSPLEADAMTVAAFQGVGSLAAPVRLALEAGKGLFVLAATSNPEAAPLQRARVEGGTTVAATILEEVRRAGGADGGVASIGVVLGATLDLGEFGIDIADAPDPALPVLAPGFGHQGARLEDASRIFGGLLQAAIVSESRSLLAAGPDGIRAAVERRSREVQDALG